MKILLNFTGQFTLFDCKIFQFYKILSDISAPNSAVAVAGDLVMQAASLGRQKSKIPYGGLNLHNIPYKYCKYFEYIVKNMKILSTIYHIPHNP